MVVVEEGACEIDGEKARPGTLHSEEAGSILNFAQSLSAFVPPDVKDEVDART